MPKQKEPKKTRKRSSMSALEMVLATSGNQIEQAARKVNHSANTDSEIAKKAIETVEKTIEPDGDLTDKSQPMVSDNSNLPAIPVSGETYNISPDVCTPWEFSDRLENDLGDFDTLVKSIREEGQHQPALLRPLPYSDSNVKYEIIYGIRRWKACIELGLPLKANIEELSDRQAADRMISENMARADICEYARCKSYKNLMDAGIYKDQSDLANKIGYSKAAISELFVFSRLPTFISDVITNFSKVSIKTALKLNKLKDHEEFKQKLPELADEIMSGGIHAGNIQNKVFGTQKNDSLIHRVDNKKLFAIQRDTKGKVKVVFEKEYIDSLSVENLFEKLTKLV